MQRMFRRRLLDWYDRAHRQLPWRKTRDPYAIWISEAMLQQTRVSTVLPYYERFLGRFPDVRTLAEAPEEEVLKLWSGLGYYSRARNLQRAARQMLEGFPSDYESIRALPGVGDYTAAAVGSIAFGLPHAVLDGNVLRVLSRVSNDAGDIASSLTRKRLQTVSESLLDRRDPGRFNQAMMELGATICLPRNPQCLLCPIARFCGAREAGRQNELPVKGKRTKQVKLDRTLLLIERDDSVLMWQRTAESRRLANFWELPEPEHVTGAIMAGTLGEFRHCITNHTYRFVVVESKVNTVPERLHWIPKRVEYLFSTTTRKALDLVREARARQGLSPR